MAATWRKASAVLLAASLTLAACSGGGSGSKDGGKAAQQPAKEEGLKLKDGKFDPPVTMKLVLGHDEPFRQGETVNDNVLTRWAKERLGIEMKYLWETSSKNNGYLNKVRLELAANNPMPDVLYLPTGTTAEKQLAHDLMKSGLYREVGPLWDKYASPQWKEAMKQEPTAFQPFNVNGKIMGIPVLDFAMHQEVVMTIREDWLKKLNLKAPTNLAELEKVLDAFVNQDPDGNGKKDTFGLTLGLKDGFYNPMADAGFLFGMFGTLNDYWNDWKGDGNLQYGSVQPGAKDALAKLKEWMDKGYIHKEVGLWDGEKAAEQIAKGQAGIGFAARWAIGRYDPVIKNVPGSELKVYPLPMGPNGKAMRHASVGVHGVFLIHKDFKTPEAFFVYQNYLMEHYANPKKGGEFEFGMFEGYDYVKKDGKILSGSGDFPKEAPRVRPYKHSIDSNGARIPNQRLEAYSKVYNKQPLVTPYEIKDAAGVKPTDIDAAAITLQQKDLRRFNLFDTALTPTMVSKGEFLRKMELETYHKMMYGQEPISNWDNFVKQWNSLGGEQITKEVNDWYKTIKK